jgi:hypothetical protein
MNVRAGFSVVPQNAIVMNIRLRLTNGDTAIGGHHVVRQIRQKIQHGGQVFCRT